MSDPIPCAGAIIFDGAARLLLVKRANQPDAGRWSIPGGRCESGESAATTCVREVAEETGLAVEVLRHVGSVIREGCGELRYTIDDFLCHVVGGALLAGDDAAEARWVGRSELATLDVVPGLEMALREWSLWPVAT